MAVVWRNYNRMGMRPRLNGGIHTVSNVLDKSCQLAEGTIFADTQNRDASTAEIGQQHVFPCLVHRNEACAGPTGGSCIEQAQLASCGINCESAHVRRMIERRSHGKRVFAHGVQESMIRSDGKKRRIDHLRGQFGLTEFTRRWPEVANVNSLAMALSHSKRLAVMHVLKAGVGADVEVKVVVLGGSRVAGHSSESESENEIEGVADASHEMADLLTSSKQSKNWWQGCGKAKTRPHLCADANLMHTDTPGPELRSGLVRMITSEIKKPDLAVFILVDAGVGRFVIGNVVKRHSGSLPPQLIAYECETGSAQGGPHFFDVVMIHQMWFADRERVEGDRQHALQCGESVRAHEKRLNDVGPVAVARGNGKLVLIPHEHICVRAKAWRRWFVNHIHGQRLVAHIFNGELQIRGHQNGDIAEQISSLSCRRDGTATGLHKVNFLLPLEAGRLGRSVGCQGGVGVRVDVTENGAFLGRILCVAAGQNVPLLQ